MKSIWGKEIHFLGVGISARNGHPLIILPQEKRAKYLSQVCKITKKRRLSPSDADSLFGRLQFRESAIFGRSRRVFLVPIYQRKGGLGASISHEVTRSLYWYEKILSVPQSRWCKRQRGGPPDFIIFTDASLTGPGVAFYRPGGRGSIYSPRGYLLILSPRFVLAKV